jgi:hypothetical protein
MAHLRVTCLCGAIYEAIENEGPLKDQRPSKCVLCDRELFPPDSGFALHRTRRGSGRGQGPTAVSIFSTFLANTSPRRRQLRCLHRSPQKKASSRRARNGLRHSQHRKRCKRRGLGAGRDRFSNQVRRFACGPRSPISTLVTAIRKLKKAYGTPPVFDRRAAKLKTSPRRKKNNFQIKKFKKFLGVHVMLSSLCLHPSSLGNCVEAKPHRPASSTLDHRRTPHHTTPHFPYLTPLNYMSLVGEVRCGALCGVVAD